MSKSLQIEEKMLKGLYRCASDADKAILEEKYGKEFFTTNIMDIVISYEAACEHLGKNPIEELPYNNPTTNRHRYLNACAMLDIISEALLDGTILDWENYNQQKWWPWFNKYKSGSGFRFRGSAYGWTGTCARGGARLCLDTKLKSDHFGSHPNFLNIWNDFLNPIK